MKECIVVLGMHRSGTSVLAGLVSIFGSYLGSDLLKPANDNPKGFFENNSFFLLNEKIFVENGARWDDYKFTVDDLSTKKTNEYVGLIKKTIRNELKYAKKVVIKDPRICVLFPLWERAFKELNVKLKIILVYRSPLEVAFSLEKRDKMPVKKGLILWSHYFLLSEKYTRAYERFFVHYSNDFYKLDCFVKKLSLFTNDKITESITEKARDLYTPKLKHQHISLNNISVDLPSYLNGLIKLLIDKDFKNTNKLDKYFSEFIRSKDFFLWREKILIIKLEEQKENGKALTLQLHEQQESNNVLVSQLHEQQESNNVLVSQLQEQQESNNILRSELQEQQESSNIIALQLQEQQDNNKALECENNTLKQSYDALNIEIECFYKELLKQNKQWENASINLKENDNKYVQSFKVLEKSINEERENLTFKNKNSELKIKILQEELSQNKHTISLLSKASFLGADIVDGIFNDRKTRRLVSRSLQVSLVSIIKHAISPKLPRKLEREKKIIIESKMFSPLFYLSTYPDVLDSGMDPLTHFCRFGWKEGRMPISYFDCNEYLILNKDVAEKRTNPLVHYISYGQKEGRLPKVEASIFYDTRKLDEINSIKSKKKIGKSLARSRKNITSKVKNILNKKDNYIFYEAKYTLEIAKEIKHLGNKPLMSIIIPVYNIDEKWLRKAIESIEYQWYENWEINIADDASDNIETINYLHTLKENKNINIKFLHDNGNISNASNEALSMATGDYIVLMDHDDELTPDALYEVVKKINYEKAEFIYSDEDKVEMDGSFCDPNFKSDYAPDTFLCTNYLSHLGVIKKTLVDKVEGFTVGLEGAQDYDLYLKVLEHTNKISHISKVLYHWRKIPGSTAASFGDKSYANEAGKLALQRAMERRGIKADVVFGHSPGLYRIQYKLVSEPLVSIIIPFYEKPDLLKQCIESIIIKTTYKNYEIIGVNNNSNSKEIYNEMDRLISLDSRVKFYDYNIPFNYSKINNHAVIKYAKGSQIIFLNNDVEILTSEWIEELLMHSQHKEVGAVGCKLYYPDNTIQHAGLIIAPYSSHTVTNIFRKSDRNLSGYGSRAVITNNYLAVTAACMMLKRDLFLEIGGFDEENLKIAYNDVDLCLSLVEKGYKNVFTPHCEAYHYESASRGVENSVEKIERSRKEMHLFKEKHKAIIQSTDPYYNVNLDDHSEVFALSKLNTESRDVFSPKVFQHKIIKNNIIRNKSKNYLCIFSHFDQNGIIDDYVVAYLKSLSIFSDIIFVSTADNLSDKEINKIKNICIQVVAKENYAYDFGAWKTGMDLSHVKLSHYDYLILCNDSVYGPFYALDKLLEKNMKNTDVFAMTDSYEIAHHLQSYFVVYSKKAFSHTLFKDFWGNFVVYENKSKLIKENEVKFSNKLINSNLKISTYCKAENAGYLNQLHFYWDNLIFNKKYPFVKIELLRCNPQNINIDSWENIITNTGYDIKLIKNHLNRI